MLSAVAARFEFFLVPAAPLPMSTLTPLPSLGNGAVFLRRCLSLRSLLFLTLLLPGLCLLALLSVDSCPNPQCDAMLLMPELEFLVLLLSLLLLFHTSLTVPDSCHALCCRKV